MKLLKYTIENENGNGVLVINNLLGIFKKMSNAENAPSDLLNCWIDFLKILFDEKSEPPGFDVKIQGTFSINPRLSRPEDRVEMEFSYSFFYNIELNRSIPSDHSGSPVWIRQDGTGKVAGYVRECDNPKEWHLGILQAMQMVSQRTFSYFRNKTEVIERHLSVFRRLSTGA